MYKVATVIFLTIFLNLALASEEISKEKDMMLEKNCLLCHKKEQIPSELIYKRYLLKYSTKDRIKKAIFNYLKNPKKENSIMPRPFFLKFPMKKKLNLDDKQLRENIELFIKRFDIKKKLVLAPLS